MLERPTILGDKINQVKSQYEILTHVNNLNVLVVCSCKK